MRFVPWTLLLGVASAYQVMDPQLPGKCCITLKDKFKRTDDKCVNMKTGASGQNPNKELLLSEKAMGAEEYNLFSYQRKIRKEKRANRKGEKKNRLMKEKFIELAFWQRDNESSPFSSGTGIMGEDVAWGILFHTHTHSLTLTLIDIGRGGKVEGRRGGDFTVRYTPRDWQRAPAAQDNQFLWRMPGRHAVNCMSWWRHHILMLLDVSVLKLYLF